WLFLINFIGLKGSIVALNRFRNDGLHFRQPWVMAVEEEVERLKQRVHDHDKFLRECEALKSQVRRLGERVADLERLH
ncbi:hypothetical protein HID58_076191, partial [Brassica napus]